MFWLRSGETLQRRESVRGPAEAELETGRPGKLGQMLSFAPAHDVQRNEATQPY
ncbi:hypothetical protein LEMLEM_LOCUS13114 [Lemmus lemmus]